MTTSTTELTLRRSTAADREVLLAVYASTRADEMAAVAGPDEQKAQFLRMQAEAQDVDYRTNHPDAELLVITVDGVDAGRLYRRELDDELRLMDLSLLPAWRGRGIGTALLTELIEEAAGRHMTVSLHVEHWNPARRLYDRLGFVPTAQNDVYLRMERAPSVVASGGRR